MRLEIAQFDSMAGSFSGKIILKLICGLEFYNKELCSGRDEMAFYLPIYKNTLYLSTTFNSWYDHCIHTVF